GTVKEKVRPPGIGGPRNPIFPQFGNPGHRVGVAEAMPSLPFRNPSEGANLRSVPIPFRSASQKFLLFTSPAPRSWKGTHEIHRSGILYASALPEERLRLLRPRLPAAGDDESPGPPFQKFV